MKKNSESNKTEVRMHPKHIPQPVIAYTGKLKNWDAAATFRESDKLKWMNSFTLVQPHQDSGAKGRGRPSDTIQITNFTTNKLQNCQIICTCRSNL